MRKLFLFCKICETPYFLKCHYEHILFITMQMIAKGKNASMLFPAVVKNVACKNIEVKKLVYVYLERYAEEQQDLALLSISTFQRGLKVT